MPIIEIKDSTYQVEKLDVFKQFHVIRRMAPILGEMGVAYQKRQEKDESSWLEALAGPFAEALASMDDERTEYILCTCLSVVTRKQVTGGVTTWSPVLLKGTKSVMFEDIQLSLLIELAFEVLKDSLGNFLSTTPSSPLSGK